MPAQSVFYGTGLESSVYFPSPLDSALAGWGLSVWFLYSQYQTKDLAYSRCLRNVGGKMSEFHQNQPSLNKVKYKLGVVWFSIYFFFFHLLFNLKKD